MDPWEHVKILKEESGSRVKSVQCLFCDHVFTVTSVTRIRGHLVSDSKRGARGCPKVSDTVKAALEEEDKAAEAAKLAKKRKQEVARTEQEVVRLYQIMSFLPPPTMLLYPSLTPGRILAYLGVSWGDPAEILLGYYFWYFVPGDPRISQL